MNEQTKRAALRKELWVLAYPTMIAFALQSFYDIVDMAWVGKISIDAMSGVTLFSTLYMMFTVLNEVAGTSSISLIAQAYGRGDMERTRVVAEQTIAFKVVLAVISAVLLYLFLEPLVDLYSTDPVVRQAAIDYGMIRVFFLPLAFSSYSVNTIFRCTHDAKTPMKIMIISTILNIVLDPLFMFDVIPYTSIPGLGLGVFGAGLATVTATTVSFLYGFFLLFSGKRDVRITWKGLFRLHSEIDRKLITIGLPSGLQLLVRRLFDAILILFVTSYGTAAVAVAGIATKLTGFALMPIFGFQIAGSSLVGYAMGRRDIAEVRTIASIASRLNFAIVAAAMALCSIFPEPILLLFNNDPTLLSEGIPMIRMVGISLAITAISFGRKCVFSGSGHTGPQLYATLFSRWCVQLPLLWLIVSVWQLPLPYLWLTYIAAELGDFIVVQYHFKKEVWAEKRI